MHTVAEIYVVAAEARLGVSFPRVYRHRMMRRNGGTVEVAGDLWDLHPIADASSPNRMGPTWDDVCRQTEQARMLGGFPATAVAIADDGSGDRLVLLAVADGGDMELAIWRHVDGGLERLAAALDAAFGGAR